MSFSKLDEFLLFNSLNSFAKDTKSSFLATKSVSQLISITDILFSLPDVGETKIKEASSKTIQEIDREKLDAKFSKKDKEKLN